MPSPLITREKTAMQYKTIVLELLKEQHPTFHEQLRASRTLLQAMNDYAANLKRHHESWMERLTLKKPDRDPVQIASEALELALVDLRDDLPSESEPTDAEETFSLDAAIASIRRHTPPA
jgi:hypothetical protein